MCMTGVIVTGKWIFLATMVWSNGRLNGTVFLPDSWRVGWRLMAGEEGGVRDGGRWVVGWVGDWEVLVAVGLAFPQWVPYGK